MITERQVDKIVAELRNWRSWVGNNMLDRLDVPNVGLPEKRREELDRFRKRLEFAKPEQLQALREFFEIGSFAHTDPVWPHPGFRLFISHRPESMDDISPLSRRLANDYGIHSFLSGKDIRHGDDWLHTLMEAVSSMEGLISFHSPDYSSSNWCNQEIGAAIGRGVPIVPIKAGEAPPGFLSRTQAVKWRPNNLKQTVDDVLEMIARHDRGRERLGESLSRELKFSPGWDYTTFCVSELGAWKPLSKKARRNVELALLLNDQVYANEDDVRSLLE